MRLTFAPRDYLQIDDAVITFRNFAGKGDMYNREGDRNFALIIPDIETAQALKDRGWNVTIKPRLDEFGNIVPDEPPFIHLKVKVKFTDFGPNIWLKSGEAMTKLNEQTVGCLDRIAIAGVDLDIRPYDWVLPSGKKGRSAYLDGIRVTQRIDDRFAPGDDSDQFPWG